MSGGPAVAAPPAVQRMPPYIEAYLAQVEGFAAGYHITPGDNGKGTNKGITEATFATARTLGVVPVYVHLEAITDAQALTIYHRLYWLPSRACEMPAALAWAHLDSFVQHRPGVSTEMLQRALGVPDDGAMGPVTLAAAKTCGGDGLGAARRLVKERSEFYDRLAEKPRQAKFRRGWHNRLTVLSLAIQSRFGSWS